MAYDALRPYEAFRAFQTWLFTPYAESISYFLDLCQQQGSAGLDYAHALLEIVTYTDSWRLSHPQRRTLLTMIDAAVDAYRVDFAFKLLRLADPHIVPDATYVRLAEVCGSLGRRDHAFEVLMHLKRVNMPATKALLETLLLACDDTIVYDDYTNDRCAALLEGMEEHGLLPTDQYTLSILMELFVERGAFAAGID